jgi:hypothetical protein
MKKISIFGDSFSEPDWAKNDKYLAWPELLTNDFSITNYSLSGSSMWWSYKKWKEVRDTCDYNIFVVTIPGRIYVESLDRHLNFNPTTWPRWFGINFGELWFKYFYSEERELAFHNFMLEDVLKHSKTLVIPAFIESMPGINSVSLCHLADLEMYHYGLTHSGTNERRKCHLTKENNLVVYGKIIDAIKNEEKVLKLFDADYVIPKEDLSYYWF